MATDLRQLPAFLGDDATFRTWGSGIAAQLAAIGLVKTSDTGQINWASVARPGTGDTFAGYEVWRFNDSLQATKPVFIKIEYGVAFIIDRPRLRVIVSTATNGAGTPSGQVGATRTLGAGTSKTAGVTLPSHCAGSSSRLNLCTNLDATITNHTIGVMVERTKNGAGADTGDGIVAYSFGTAGSYQFMPFTGAIPTAGGNNPALDCSAGGQTVSGTDVLLAPTVCFYGKPLFASWCVYRTADPGIAGQTALSVNHFGATHTYMPLGAGAAFTTNSLTTAAPSVAMLWE